MKAPNIENLKATIRQLNDAIKAKVAERVELTAELEKLNTEPPDRAAILELLHSEIDLHASYYPGEIRAQLTPFLNNWSRRDLTRKTRLNLQSAREKPEQRDSTYNPPTTTGIFYLLREPIKAALARVVSEIDLPAGISNSERDRRMTALNERIAAIDCELTGLFDECAGLGIALPDTTLSADERETRRRAAAYAENIKRNGTSRMVDTPFPGDEKLPKHVEPPRTSAFQCVDLPVNAFRYDEGLAL